MKTLKSSNRGLTFSLENDEAQIGTKYRYIIDKKEKCVKIIPDENGNITASRKKCGNNYKPLFDIRSKEVKELVSNADYLEVEVKDNEILVHAYKKIKDSFLHLVKSNIVRIDDVLCKKTGTISLSHEVVGLSSEEAIIAATSLFNDISRTMRDISSKIERKDIERVYDIASLFSGAGLLDYAFKDPQFRFKYAVDFDKDACETYRYNIGDHIECRDIREVEASEVPDVDVVIGGPCCQGYSNANRHDINKESARKKRLLIEDYVRIVLEKRPKVFVIENVPQFLTKEGGIYLRHVTENLECEGYSITATVVCDSEVGGYSTRKRAVIIGSLIGEIKLPDTKIHTMKTVRDAISKVDPTWFNYNDLTKSSAETQLTMSYVPDGGNWKDVPEEIHKFGPMTQSNIYRRLEWDQPACTIVNWRKCLLMPPHGTPEGDNRILNVSEAAAIMGLDKNFHVLGSSIGSRQQQIGNGITQKIGSLIKETVLKTLNKAFAPNC